MLRENTPLELGARREAEVGVRFEIIGARRMLPELPPTVEGARRVKPEFDPPIEGVRRENPELDPPMFGDRRRLPD